MVGYFEAVGSNYGENVQRKQKKQSKTFFGGPGIRVDQKYWDCSDRSGNFVGLPIHI